MRRRAAGSLAACAILAAALTCAPLPADAGDASKLPDSEVTSSLGVTAYLTEPTTRYDHGVLGDAIEAGGFTVEAKGVRLHYRLGGDAVFEDRRVRLADIDGDDAPEAIIIKSDLKRGAAIAAFRILADRIVLLAESAPAGRTVGSISLGWRIFSATASPRLPPSSRRISRDRCGCTVCGATPLSKPHALTAYQPYHWQPGPGLGAHRRCE